MKYKKFILMLIFFICITLFYTKSYASNEFSKCSELISDKEFYELREEKLSKSNTNLFMQIYKSNETLTTEQKITNFIIEEGKKNVDENVYTNLAISNYKIREFDINTYNIKLDYIHEILFKIYEQPELFYCAEVGYTWYEGDDGIIYIDSILLTYYLNQAEIDSALETIELETQKFLNTIEEDWTNLEKILHTNDYICKLVDYNYDACDVEINSTTNEVVWKVHRMNGALVDKSPVCDGYSRTMVYLLDKIGISSSLVTSSEMNHAWNMVNLNGSYYHIDVTWNDMGYNGRTQYQYFLISDTEITTNREHYNYYSYNIANNTQYDETQIWNNTVSYLTYHDDYWYYLNRNTSSSEIVLNKIDLNNNKIINTKSITSDCINEKIVYPPCLTTDGRYFYFNGVNAFYMMDFEENVIKEYYNTTDKIFDMVYFNDIFYYDIVVIENSDYVAKPKMHIPINDLKFTNSEINVDINDKTYTLKPTFYPENHQDKNELTWQSSNSDIATVDSAGKLNLLSTGNTIITATTINGISATCNVNVEIPIASIELNKSEVTLNIEEHETLIPTILPNNTTQDKKLMWESSNTEIVEVDSNGFISAKTPGTAQIKATSKNGISDTCKVTVKSPITGIELNKNVTTLNKGSQEKLEVKILPTNTTDDKTLTWESSNTNILEVANDGTITAKDKGTAQIKVTTKNGISAICNVTVNLPITEIQLNKTTITLNIEEQEELTATILPINTTDNKTITWQSSNTQVAEIDNTGKIKAKMPGTANITAKTVNGITATCKVTVKSPITEIKLNKNSLTLNVFQKQKLTTTILPSNTTESKKLIWKSNNTQIADVNSDGTITAKSVGKTIITVTTENGKKSSCEITVKLPFKDVKDTDWFFNAVKYVYSNNIIRGYNESEFAPNDKVTRGMLVTIIYRMEGEPAISGKPKFPDVQKSSEYYYKAVKWATDKKIISGYNNGKFGPNDNVTREQVAVILNKYAKYKGKNTSATNNLNEFKDKNKISDYAINQMKWAVGAGVITGNANKTLNPKGNATRAEIAAMFEKYCRRIGR